MKTATLCSLSAAVFLLELSSAHTPPKAVPVQSDGYSYDVADTDSFPFGEFSVEEDFGTPDTGAPDQDLQDLSAYFETAFGEDDNGPPPGVLEPPFGSSDFPDFGPPGLEIYSPVGQFDVPPPLIPVVTFSSLPGYPKISPAPTTSVAHSVVPSVVPSVAPGVHPSPIFYNGGEYAYSFNIPSTSVAPSIVPSVTPHPGGAYQSPIPYNGGEYGYSLSVPSQPPHKTTLVTQTRSAESAPAGSYVYSYPAANY